MTPTGNVKPAASAHRLWLTVAVIRTRLLENPPSTSGFQAITSKCWYY